MSCDEELAPPSGTVRAKRPGAKALIQFDWHDFLIHQRVPGRAYSLNEVFRPKRRDATGFQYRCTSAGTASGRPNQDLRFPRTAGTPLDDGNAEFTAEPVTPESLRATISTSNFPAVTDITITDESVTDMVYTAYAAGGFADTDYQISQEVTLSGAPGELEVAVMVLPVRN